MEIPLSETLVDVDFLDANNGWIVGNDGVARTLDGGQTWETFVMPHGQSFLYGAAYFSNIDKGWLVGSLSHILKFDAMVNPVFEAESAVQLPAGVVLHQNYPNPFNPETTIAYILPQKSEVKINVYNNLGQLVKTLNQGFQPAGFYQVKWNGRNNSGNLAASGVYYYQLSAGTFSAMRKMVLLR